MTETTFDQPEPERHFDPERWESIGISSAEGERWWTHRVEPGDALSWRRAGVSEPIDAVRWKIAGVNPSTVREWVYAEIDAREAVVWAELGFNSARARVHKRAGRTAVQAHGHDRGGGLKGGSSSSVSSVMSSGFAGPGAPLAGPGAPPAGPHRLMQALGARHMGRRHLLHSYMSRQWFDDEAIAWATHGIDASDALAWKELGLTPVEAERQQAQGLGAMQTAKAWWRAGIPVDEVADWIGAGLTPEEAAGQRAKGVTGERAAVLRSLRKDKPAD
jgi:hypothetical protein